MKFVKPARPTAFKNGARLAWIGDPNQDCIVVRINNEWFHAETGEPQGSPDSVYARELEAGDWVEV